MEIIILHSGGRIGGDVCCTLRRANRQKYILCTSVLCTCVLHFSVVIATSPLYLCTVLVCSYSKKSYTIIFSEKLTVIRLVMNWTK